LDDIIIGEKLTKRFGNKIAVDNIDIRVHRGETFGFLGPNGAGKTTTIRLLTTLSNLDSGTATIDGHDIVKDPVGAKACMGVMQQHISLDKDLTVRENMIQHGMYQKIPGPERKRRIDELVEYIGLEEYVDYKVDALSGGWKKRVAIVCALIHRPQILFLDEPTVGLDIKARRLIWDVIRKLHQNGTTIFLTTHYIEEAEALCDRVAFIDHGKIIAVGTPGELCRRVGLTAVEYFDEEKKTRYVYFSSRDEATDFAKSLTVNDSVTIRNTNLEDCFVELTGESVGDA
jgi:ABC-2 type transport system ATP-binding protein